MSETPPPGAPAAVPLTVVMPAYNEEEAIGEAVAEVRRLVLDAVPGADCLVIDDGSRDRTGAILDRLADDDPRVRVVHQPNAGHGAALRLGMDRASGEYLFLIDSDRQIPAEAFADLWRLARVRDGAFGVRADRHDPAVRRALSRLIGLAVRLLFGVSLRDANVPFKLIRRSAWVEARRLIPEGTLAPSLFLAVYARSRGLDVAEREVPHRPRRTGVGSVRRLKLLTFSARGFGQLLAFRARLGRRR